MTPTNQAPVYLDTETTGFSAATDRIVEIAVVDDSGAVLLDKLVNPERPIPEAVTTHVHGITDEMVSEQPTLGELLPRLRAVLAGRPLVIYNAGFDLKFLPAEVRDTPSEVHCCLKRFRMHIARHKLDLKSRNLAAAAELAGHRWEGAAHRALADTQATRTVWRWLDSQA